VEGTQLKCFAHNGDETHRSGNDECKWTPAITSRLVLQNGGGGGGGVAGVFFWRNFRYFWRKFWNFFS
jgi:hypothetical protein